MTPIKKEYPPITADQRKEIVSLQKSVQNLPTEIKIHNQPELETALKTLEEIKGYKKVYKEKVEEEIIAPFKTALSNLVSFVKPFKDRLDFAEQSIKKAVLDYKIAQAPKIEEKKAAVMTKVAEGDMSVKTASKQIEKIEAKTDIIPTRKVRVVKVVDENKVPEKYWVIDMVALRRDALEKDAPEIPGVKVVVEETIVN